MKRPLFFILSLSLLLSCSSDEDKETYWFKNPTEYNVYVKPFEDLLDGSPDFTFNLAAGETKAYKSDYMYGAFQIKSNATQRNFGYNFDGDYRVVYSFNKAVEYKITGTATSANITFYTSDGDVSQRTVSLPYTVGFNYYGYDFKYISAQNNTSSGSVKVELYEMDSLISSDFCNGGYCIAETSN